MLLAGSVVLVLIVELLNTGMEAAIDRIGPEWHELSKNAKDMGSAAVLLACCCAAPLLLPLFITVSLHDSTRFFHLRVLRLRPGRTRLHRSRQGRGPMDWPRGGQLVYGGGRSGLMGVVAEATRQAGGRVVGIIPRHWSTRNWPTGLRRAAHRQEHARAQGHDGRAQRCLLALPGGIGTFEELFEVWTWRQLGYHDKPIGLLNVDGYYDAMLQFLQLRGQRLHGRVADGPDRQQRHRHCCRPWSRSGPGARKPEPARQDLTPPPTPTAQQPQGCGESGALLEIAAWDRCGRPAGALGPLKAAQACPAPHPLAGKAAAQTAASSRSPVRMRTTRSTG
jgi:uncharacterized protein (TIGR00730 family)